MNENEPAESNIGRLGVAGWIAILAMVGFLLWAVWYSVHTWNALAGTGISGIGWAFIIVGVGLTVALGAGLMALVFYSSRKNFDR